MKRVLVPHLFRDVLESAARELRESGFDPEEAHELATRISQRFCAAHPGRVYRVPLLKGLKNAERDKSIRAQAGSMTVQQLCRKYVLSRCHVHQILRDESYE